MDWKHWAGIALAIVIVMAIVKFAKTKSEVVDKYL